jgi:hypothetical protein
MVFLVSLVLAGLTFSPKESMWREVPWGFYYAAVDKFGSSGGLTNQPSSIRKIQSVADVSAELGGASCQTEVYFVSVYLSQDDLSNQIAKLEDFRSLDSVDSWHVVERGKRLAPHYVLAYTCY